MSLVAWRIFVFEQDLRADSLSRVLRVSRYRSEIVQAPPYSRIGLPFAEEEDEELLYSFVTVIDRCPSIVQSSNEKSKLEEQLFVEYLSHNRQLFSTAEKKKELGTIA